MCHFVDALTYLSGSLPVEVQAVAARGLSDAVSILIRFADGSTGAVIYSSLGDPSVPKEYLEAFADGRVVQLEDYTRLRVTTRGMTTTTKAAADKGQAGLLAAFLAAKSPDAPPIPLSEMIAVTEATLPSRTHSGSAPLCRSPAALSGPRPILMFRRACS